MKINDTVTFFGQTYQAVEYPGQPADFLPDPDGDPQCKLCQLAPNFCKMKSQCHNEEKPFVFAKPDHVMAMEYCRALKSIK